MVAFQFQDRVSQILEQVSHSIRDGADRLQRAIADGRVPSREEWDALLGAGYTTDEQRAISSAPGSVASARTPQPQSDTTFF